MVEPLRQDVFKVDSPQLNGGVYVIGKLNVSDRNVPYVQIIERGENAVKYGLSQEVLNNYCDGDVINFDDKRGSLRTLLSANAKTNTLLVTERCDNRCVFCSQPPNDFEDNHLYVKAAIAIINFDTKEFVGISGGEPTYNRSAFLNLLKILKQFHNKTPLHILSNGRSFSDTAYIKQISEEINDKVVLWGIPLYGHKASLHDELVQSDGAFVDTVQGLLNASEYGFLIELRIVPTARNIGYLGHIVSFVAENIPFVNCISIMNLEPKGWARKNYNSLYVEVKKQNPSLLDAYNVSRKKGLNIRLFNYPLCLIDEKLRRIAVKSISDWKNYYPPECEGCKSLDDCGGFFTSATGKFIEPVEAIK